jgi:DNA-binding MarR family transcriptional regulator
MLDKLEQRGWITRERPASNRRLVLVRITDQGLALLMELDKPVQECHERQLGHLGEADLRKLISLLESARRPHELEGPWHDRKPEAKK